MRIRRRSLSLAFAAALIAVGVAASRTVTASCLPLDLTSIPRTDQTTVFAGTVTAVQSGHVFLNVDAWFLGNDPVGSAEVIGGNGSNEPGVITSVDWAPQPGERWLVVAERAGPQGFDTQPCQQVPIDVGVVQQATKLFGAPLEPPFAVSGSGSPSSPPTAAPAASSSALPSASIAPENTSSPAAGLVPAAIVGILLLASALAAWGLSRRGH